MIVFIINCIGVVNKKGLSCRFDGRIARSNMYNRGRYEKARRRQCSRILERSDALCTHQHQAHVRQIREHQARVWFQQQSVEARIELEATRREYERLHMHMQMHELSRRRMSTHRSSLRLPRVVTTGQVSTSPSQGPTTPRQKTSVEDIWREKEPCVICFDAYTSKENIELTRCNHHMCRKCKAELVTSVHYITQPKCPMCRHTYPFVRGYTRAKNC